MRDKDDHGMGEDFEADIHALLRDQCRDPAASHAELSNPHVPFFDEMSFCLLSSPKLLRN